MKPKIYGDCPLCNQLKAHFTDEVEKLPLIMDEFRKFGWDTQPMIVFNDELVEYVKGDVNDAVRVVKELINKGETK
jgi:hypothetical protein